MSMRTSWRAAAAFSPQDSSPNNRDAPTARAQHWIDGAVMAISSLVQVVLHDAAVAPLPIAFQCENIPFRSEVTLGNSVNRGQVGEIELYCTNTGVGVQMRCVGCTNNDRRDPGALQHNAGCHGGDVAGVLIGDAAQDSQQLLEQVPAAEIINDQLVFDQRPVGELLAGLGLAQPAVREKAPRNCSITQQSDASGLTGLDHSIHRTGIQE